MGKRVVYRGTVVDYYPGKRFGFIKTEVESRDVFFHIDAYCESVEVNGEVRFLIPNQDLRLHPEDPTVGDMIVFMAIEELRGPKATHWDFVYEEEGFVSTSA